MTPEQRSWWRIALELRLRKCSGKSFQDFFADVMAKRHGSDYVRVRPSGRLGDKGCDGYLQSLGQVFACYGALNGSSGRVSYLIAKMAEDFSKALAALPSIMKEWHMVHNLVDGLPVEAIEKLEAMRTADTQRKFGFVGLEGFEERIFALDPEKIEDLLGVAASSRDAQNLQAAQLRDLINDVAAATDAVQADFTAIRPVPPEKLAFNNLPGHWRWLIAAGWQNSHLVSGYIGQHHDPLIGERVADAFRTRYRYLKAQDLAPGAIMSGLYEMVGGTGGVSAQRQVAIQALLAFLFESCDIFEGRPGVAQK